MPSPRVPVSPRPRVRLRWLGTSGYLRSSSASIPRSRPSLSRVLHLTPISAEQIRSEIKRARGNEVCFLAYVGEEGDVYDPRAVARGHKTAVLAAVKQAEAGMLPIHNHPSGELEASDPDLEVANSLHGMGVGLAITDNQA